MQAYCTTIEMQLAILLTNLRQELKGAFDVLHLDTHYGCLQTHINLFRMAR